MHVHNLVKKNIYIWKKINQNLCSHALIGIKMLEGKILTMADMQFKWLFKYCLHYSDNYTPEAVMKMMKKT